MGKTNLTRKTWNVRMDGKDYLVEFKNNSRVIINGSELELRKCKRKGDFVHTEYEIPIENKKAILAISNMKAPQLVIDNIDYETGQKYVPVKMPGWSYIFLILQISLIAISNHVGSGLVGGAIGGGIVGVGVVLSMAVACNNKLSTISRVLYDIVILVLTCFVLYGVGFFLGSL